jgi:hypothetical protein
VQHKGWEVYKQLIEFEIDRASVDFLEVQPQDEINYRRGVIKGHIRSLEAVDGKLREFNTYNARKHDERAGSGERDISAHWGSPAFYSEFDKRGR